MTLINQTPLLALKVVIDLGLGLDEPIAFQPAAPAAEPPTAPAAELTPNRPKPDIGTGLDWQTARDRRIALRRGGESFSSLRDLAARVGCSEGLIRKAIKSDVGLRAWAAEAKRTRRTAPAATSLDHAVRRVPQRCEVPPDTDAADSDTPADEDAVLQRLIEAASPSERARLHACYHQRSISPLSYPSPCRTLHCRPMSRGSGVRSRSGPMQRSTCSGRRNTDRPFQDARNLSLLHNKTQSPPARPG
jgi:hypothetical protein